jgi:hypothetical protein
MDVHLLGPTVALWHDRATMEIGHARAIAERLHVGDCEEDGTPVIRHVQRVATMVPEEARAVAWLHEVLEWTAVTEQELLIAGLTNDELRALRLLNRTTDSHSDRRYLAHLDLVAHATGDSGRMARIVKTADLKDRFLHPHVRRDGWSPPYTQALNLLSEARDDPHRVGTAGVA